MLKVIYISIKINDNNYKIKKDYHTSKTMWEKIEMLDQINAMIPS